ncbi:MAG: hypothetical protein LKI80_01010 [Sporolactobacillus sp.]|jgi:hypothetical protein|nr:hypothetical protein [Sporolactobacillus sp.]
MSAEKKLRSAGLIAMSAEKKSRSAGLTAMSAEKKSRSAGLIAMSAEKSEKRGIHGCIRRINDQLILKIATFIICADYIGHFGTY